MREQLIKYIDLLFAGAPEAEDIKQEILQNTLDRYDDLISQGKSPESAYSLAISGIGDINEILGGNPSLPQKPDRKQENPKDAPNSRLCRAAAIMFFILCPIPVIILENVLGVCLLLAMVAAGVGLLVFFGKEDTEIKVSDTRSGLHKVLHGITWGGGLAVYFVLSFSTGAWYITWLVFPIIGVVCGLISAVFDLNKQFLSAVIRIVLLGVLALVLCGILLGSCLAVDIFSGTLQEFFTETPEQNFITSGGGSVPSANVKDIQIQWVSGSITVVPGDVTEIQFSETGNFSEKDRMVWKQNGDSLVIQFCKGNLSLIGKTITFSKDLTITVPRDWICRDMEIDSVSARIQVNELRATEVELVNVSGTCLFTQCSVDDFSMETVSGNVRYEGTLRELDMDTVSANCTAVLSVTPEKVDMDAVSGDLELILPNDAGFTLDLDSLSGDFTSEFATTSSEGRHICGDGSCRITADSVSGNISINMP